MSDVPTSNLLTSLGSTPPLSTCLNNSTPGRIGDRNLFRRYAGGLSSHFHMHGVPDSDLKNIVYNVGIRNAGARPNLRRELDEVRSYQCSVQTGEIMMMDLVGLCRRFGATSPRFERMDLCALGAQASRSLAVYVQRGLLTCAEIRGGRPILLRASANTDMPLNPSLGHIFIPRSVDEVCNGTFAVLVSCASAYGATVFTDVLEVNAANQPQLMEPVGADAAMACYGAMRILLSMYDSMGHGGVMAYAITKGAHDVATVVGHSDEGGYIRDVIRRGDFSKPFGGVSDSHFKSYHGLPAPTSTSESTFTALVDSILLMTAGASAISDPCVVIGGRVYPTVFTADSAENMEGGRNVEGDADDVDNLTQQIALGCGAYVNIYLDQIARVFHTSHSGEAKAFMRTQFGDMVGTRSRHLAYVVVAPFYWIEPTSLFDSVWDTAANAAGFGTFAGTESTVVKSFFEKVNVMQDHTNHSFLSVSHRSMRTNPIYVMLCEHRLNGISHIIPTQFEADKVVLKGGVNTVAVDRGAGAGLDDYKFNPLQCTIPHPASFIYTGAAMGVRIVKTVWNEVNFSQTVNHVFVPSDLNCEIISVANRPNRILNGANLAGDRNILRARSVAATALHNARNTSSGGLSTGGEILGAGDFEPVEFRDGDIAAGGGDMEREIAALSNGVSIRVTGNPIPHFISATPDRFRVIQARIAGAGAAAVRPAVAGVREVVRDIELGAEERGDIPVLPDPAAPGI